MQRMKLALSKREAVGTRQVRRLRADGIVPGVVYGHGQKVMQIEVPIKAINDVKGGHIHENALLDITVTDDGKSAKRTVIVQEIQKDVLKGSWLHIDFKEVSLKEKLKTVVRLEATGDAAGVVEGGVLDVIIHELEIECLPTDIPEAIKVDITNLVIGDSVYVKDIALPEGVTLLTNSEQPAIAVSAPRVEEEVVAEVPVEEGAEGPEVISKGKKEEEEIPEGGEPKADKKAETKGKE